MWVKLISGWGGVHNKCTTSWKLDYWLQISVPSWHLHTTFIPWETTCTWISLSYTHCHSCHSCQQCLSYSWLCHWLQVTHPAHPTPDLIQPFVMRGKGRGEAGGLRLCISSNHPYSYGQLLVGFPLLTKLKRQAGRAHCKGSPPSFCKPSNFF